MYSERELDTFCSNPYMTFNCCSGKNLKNRLLPVSDSEIQLKTYEKERFSFNSHQNEDFVTALTVPPNKI